MLPPLIDENCQYENLKDETFDNLTTTTLYITPPPFHRLCFNSCLAGCVVVCCSGPARESRVRQHMPPVPWTLHRGPPHHLSHRYRWNWWIWSTTSMRWTAVRVCNACCGAHQLHQCRLALEPTLCSGCSPPRSTPSSKPPTTMRRTPINGASYRWKNVDAGMVFNGQVETCPSRG